MRSEGLEFVGVFLGEHVFIDFEGLVEVLDGVFAVFAFVVDGFGGFDEGLLDFALEFLDLGVAGFEEVVKV